MPNETTAPVPRTSVKEWTETAKNLLDILKSILLVTVIAVLVFDRSFVSDILDRMNASKVALGSFTVERDQVAQSMETNADALPKSQAALREATGKLEALRASYKQATEALDVSQSAIAELQRGHDPRFAPASVRHARELSAAVLAKVPGGLSLGEEAARQVKRASANTDRAVRQLPGAGTSGARFGLVFGGHRNPLKAAEQLERGRGLALGQLHLFNRSGVYGSVAVFGSREQAIAALPAFRRIRYAADAYVVNLGSWCPGVEPAGDVVECGL